MCIYKHIYYLNDYYWKKNKIKKTMQHSIFSIKPIIHAIGDMIIKPVSYKSTKKLFKSSFTVL